MSNYGIDEYQQALKRSCEECGQPFTIGQYLDSSPDYFSRPWGYRAGCNSYCLACWLGVGPRDFPAQDDEGSTDMSDFSGHTSPGDDFQVERSKNSWTYEAHYEPQMEGDLLAAFERFLHDGANLVVMPIARLHLDRPIRLPGAITFYPPGAADLDQLNLIPNRDDTNSLAELSSAASGITLEIIENHSFVVFPYEFDWEALNNGSHESHLDFIRLLSEEVDERCLNLARYRSCQIGSIDDLPAHAGQVESNHMMAAALLYSGKARKSRIIGGAAFTHFFTRGLGLTLNQPEWDSLPRDGETGQIVSHALSLYSSLLELESPTARFMQALGLLEFLAYPDKFQRFKYVSRVIARYVAQDLTDYQRLLERFIELTSAKDAEGNAKGYRTRIVHIGDRIENLVPDAKARKQLFLELDGYIRHALDHMVRYSELSFEDYLKIRDTLRPF